MKTIVVAQLRRAVGCAVCLCAAAASAENIVFPADAGVVNVAQPPYNAKGDGVADDTEAIQRALTDAVKGGGPLIYLPNGTYRISDTLRWAGRQTRDVLQGQSQDGTVIKLADHCPGFGNPAKPQAMVWTGEFPPQRFRNAIRNLTFDSGKGNPGAIGARFNASNQGQMSRVTIRSGDRAGVIGLDMGFTGDVGPLLVKHLRVVGFDVGIHTSHATAAQTLEFVTLEHQNVCGWVNDGQTLAVRKLTSRNAVTALWNKTGSGMIALLDADLAGDGAASAVTAIINSGGMYARNVRTSGYRAAIDGRQGTGRSVEAASVDEFVSHPVLSQFPSPARALNLAVEETPDVPWDDPKDWVSVAKFPPKAVTVQRQKKQKDGSSKPFEASVVDWTDSIQQAIDSGAKTVCFPRDRGTNAPYEVLGTVHIRGNVQRLIGLENSFGKEGAGVFQLDDGAAPVVVIERFDWMYCPITIRTASQRTLVVAALPGAHYDIAPGSRVFLEDVVAQFRMGKGARVWARQFNEEYTNEERRHAVKTGPSGMKEAVGTLNDGGDLWVLGIKTEGDGTLITTINGGKTEVLGGLIYANKNYNPDKQAFVIRDASFSLSVREFVSRQQPFHMVAETRGSETRVLKAGAAPGGTYVLYAGQAGEAPAEPTAAPTAAAPLPPGSGTGLQGDYYTNSDFTGHALTRLDPGVDFDWSKTPPTPGVAAERCSVRWTGRLEPQVTGAHGFSLEPAGTRLMVDGKVVVDAWPAGTRYRFGQVWLEAGRKVNVKLEYRGSGGKAGKVSLEWRQPGQGKMAAPTSQFHPPGAAIPEVVLTASAARVAEGASVDLTFTRTGDTGQAMTVAFQPQVNLRPLMTIQWADRGDAVPGDDYRPLPDAVVIPAGQTRVTVPLVTLDDQRPEPDKTLVLSPAFSPDYAAAGRVVIAIEDNDRPPAGHGTGLTGEYFGDTNFARSVATRIDATLDFGSDKWDKKAPIAGVDPAKGYAVRWTGLLEPLFSETYRLELAGTGYGSARVWIEGKPVIDADGKDAPRTGNVALKAGQKVPVRIEYVNRNFYGSFVRLTWSSASQFEEVVPHAQLYPVAP